MEGPSGIVYFLGGNWCFFSEIQLKGFDGKHLSNLRNADFVRNSKNSVLKSHFF